MVVGKLGILGSRAVTFGALAFVSCFICVCRRLFLNSGGTIVARFSWIGLRIFVTMPHVRKQMLDILHWIWNFPMMYCVRSGVTLISVSAESSHYQYDAYRVSIHGKC